MKVTDFRVGEIYTWIFTGYCTWLGKIYSLEGGILKLSETLIYNYTNGKYKDEFHNNKNFGYIENSSFTDGILQPESLRLATPQEIQWLNKCVEEQKVVPFKFYETYEIY